MIIEKYRYHTNKPIEEEEDLLIPQEMMGNSSTLREIKKCHVKYRLRALTEDTLQIEVNVVANLILTCAYTLEPFPYEIKLRDSLIMTSDPEMETEEVIYDKGNTFDTAPYIYELIISSLPTRPVKKGAKLPKSGVGYEVMTEEEYQKSKEETLDSRLAKLDEIDFEDK